jgi:hypothetical protein
MGVLENLKSSEDTLAPVVLMYGIDGIGKSTLASEFPDAIYFHTPGERMPTGIKVPSFPVKNYLDLYDGLKELRDERHDFKWAIIDALDGFEPMVWTETCYRINQPSIEKLGFGKGYVEADKEWVEILDLIVDLQAAGMGVLILAHPSIERFESPLSEPYNRYTIKIHKRANALVRERADIIAFMNSKVRMKKTEMRGGQEAVRAEGKEREILLTPSPAYDAKNRYDMPDSITFKKGDGFNQLSKYFPPALGVE